MVNPKDIVEGRHLICEMVRKRPLFHIPWRKGDLFDEYQQWDEVRVLPVGTKFEILKTIRTNIEGVFIYVVQTNDYPCDVREKGKENHVFITDSYFLTEPTTQEPPDREIKLPSKDFILDRLKKAEEDEFKYVWGGQQPYGTQLPSLYLTPTEIAKLNDYTQRKLSQRGVDCSGYLSWATNGFTPPSTHYMVKYKDQLQIKGFTVESIRDMLEPLDVIVWKGHMGIVGAEDRVYHSILEPQPNGAWEGGVTSLDKYEFMKWVFNGDKNRKGRIPVNAITEENSKSGFVISRWYEAMHRPRFWKELDEKF